MRKVSKKKATTDNMEIKKIEDIVLQKYEALHFSDYYDVVKDDQVMKFIAGKGLTVDQAKQKFGEILAVNSRETALGYFRIIDAITGEILGECKLVPYKYDSSLLEIGYLIKERYWGQGLGTKLCKELLQLATENYPLNNIIGLINPENIASRKLLEKYGFRSYFIGIEDGLYTEKLILEKNNRDSVIDLT